MKKFSSIYQKALKRKGGEKGLKSWLPQKPYSPQKLSSILDDRHLSMMTRCVFQAGFAWKVINDKWDDFETVFFGFSPEKMVLLSPDQLSKIGKDARIVRNMQKILSVPKNAQYMIDRAKDYGSFSNYIAQWSIENIIGLHADLKKNGSRLGGMTGPRVLRSMNKDTFLLTADVVACLQGAGLDIKNTPSSQREMTDIQNTFNQWHQETGLSLSTLSRICACSVGENYATPEGH